MAVEIRVGMSADAARARCPRHVPEMPAVLLYRAPVGRPELRFLNNNLERFAVRLHQQRVIGTRSRMFPERIRLVLPLLCLLATTGFAQGVATGRSTPQETSPASVWLLFGLLGLAMATAAVSVLIICRSSSRRRPSAARSRTLRAPERKVVSQHL